MRYSDQRDAEISPVILNYRRAQNVIANNRKLQVKCGPRYSFHQQLAIATGNEHQFHGKYQRYSPVSVNRQTSFFFRSFSFFFLFHSGRAFLEYSIRGYRHFKERDVIVRKVERWITYWDTVESRGRFIDEPRMFAHLLCIPRRNDKHVSQNCIFRQKKKSYTIIKLNMILQILVNIMYAIRILNKNIGRKLLFLEYYYK